MTVEKGEVERAGAQGRCLAPADSRAEDGSDDEEFGTVDQRKEREKENRREGRFGLCLSA